MIKAFLSASVPLPDRDPLFIKTADVIAIREAVKAVVGELTKYGTIVFGGHPAITPMIAVVLRTLGQETRRRVILYQSSYFKDQFIKENDEFIASMVVPEVARSRDLSIAAMRQRMIEETKFDVGIFVGGMEGVIDEYERFRQAHPTAKIWPLASTGAAAKIIFEQMNKPRPDLFLDELTYPSLFRKLLREIPHADQ
jgi:hypothetical protein